MFFHKRQAEMYERFYLDQRDHIAQLLDVLSKQTDENIALMLRAEVAEKELREMHERAES